ncbi:hypothetical protein ABMA28_000045 [Loxostege sticticalis]|uniref:PSI domain-containing protein n=1 Tax=Loxostege sticticalis TaxID=481309 RepID=A0ABD0TQU3_LOXSC
MAFEDAYRDFSLQMKLPFDFPFYGHQLADITVCTGGYVFTGATSQLWLAQDQSISPLMANFDVSLDDSSSVVLYEDATQVTIVWEKMQIRQKKGLKFTFAVTLYKNGDIYFAYKDIPIKIQVIKDKNYSVFVGIADSYFFNKMTYYVRRKTIHNYSRIPFNAYHIQSGSVLQLIALPSCPIYNTCEACTGHEAKYGSFKCMWCEPLRKCTSGADYFRPYMADCPFTKTCNATAEDNDTMPHLTFFHRVFNFAM